MGSVLVVWRRAVTRSDRQALAMRRWEGAGRLARCVAASGSTPKGFSHPIGEITFPLSFFDESSAIWIPARDRP
jgi:hypothetical protein